MAVSVEIQPTFSGTAVIEDFHLAGEVLGIGRSQPDRIDLLLCPALNLFFSRPAVDKENSGACFLDQVGDLTDPRVGNSGDNQQAASVRKTILDALFLCRPASRHLRDHHIFLRKSLLAQGPLQLIQQSHIVTAGVIRQTDSDLCCFRRRPLFLFHSRCSGRHYLRGPCHIL